MDISPMRMDASISFVGSAFFQKTYGEYGNSINAAKAALRPSKEFRIISERSVEHDPAARGIQPEPP
jgi:hypothetical protein